MTAALASRSAPKAPSRGLRPVNLQRDLAPLAELIELCFGPMLDPSGRSAVREMRFLGRYRPLLWLVSGLATSLPAWGLGYVWEEDGRIVGNVSTQRATGDPREWIVANVAVHPDYRRRGIARALTRAALAFARSQGGAAAILQVDDDNTSAIHLYESLGFSRVTTRTTWLRHPGNVPPFVSVPFEIRPRGDGEWREQLALAEQTAPEGLTWNQPLRPANFRPSLSRRASRFVSGQFEEHWLAWVGNRLAGSLTLLTNDESYDTFTLLVHPQWRGPLERPLLVRGLRRLGRRPWPTRFEYTSDLLPAESAFAELNFRPARKLVWMKVRL